MNKTSTSRFSIGFSKSTMASPTNSRNINKYYNQSVDHESRTFCNNKIFSVCPSPTYLTSI